MRQRDIYGAEASNDLAAIKLNSLNKTFETTKGELVNAISDLTLSVSEKEFVTIVGPSGCGKSTLLRIIAGLIPASSGSVFLKGAAVNGPSSNIGLVFQKAILLPWRTVLENIMLPAEILNLNTATARERAVDLLNMVGLSQFSHKYPSELSGGMQQRVAICRALLHDPQILLMDEPFGALDAMTREQLNLDLQRISMEAGKTVVLITHSIPEGVFLGDRVVYMTPRPGKIGKVLNVDIPRPRGLEVLSDPRFGHLSNELREMLYGRGDMTKQPTHAMI